MSPSDKPSTSTSTSTQSSFREISSICVFAGSRPGKNPIYMEAAKSLGESFLKHGISLVYGGGSAGMMGMLASTIHPQGKVTGIIPSALILAESKDKIIGERSIVSTMHERKALMASLSSAFIGLPGGFGTFEELLEVITWTQLSIHSKPVGLLNVNGFFNPLIELFRQAVREGFIGPESLDIVVVSDDPNELIEKLKNCRVPSGIGANWEKNSKLI